MKWTVEKVLRKTPTLSSLPDVYARLNAAVNDPRTSSRDVANIITEDAGLAARLLRIANSAFYGFPSGIDTISRAVTLVGTRQLRDLALATSIIRQFKGISGEIISMDSFWRHSVACGVAARILATYRREPNVERFFIAGLMHDIGRLVMFIAIPDLAMETLEQARRQEALLHVTERKTLGFDHADVGGALLQQWRLPAHTVAAVTFHHRPSIDNGLHIDTAITHVSDLIANAMRLGSSGERLVPALESGAWERIGISESILASLLPELERQYQDAVSTMISDATE